MEWTNEDVTTWLIKNGFNQYVNKFKGIDESLWPDHLVYFLSILEEEIDGLSLLHLSSSSIEELLSVEMDNGVIKKPTIGVKTIFEKQLDKLKQNIHLTDT